MISCPSSERLAEFLGGSCAEPAAVESHVAVCARCRSVLDGLSDSPELRRWVPRALALSTAMLPDPGLMQVLTALDTPDGERPPREDSMPVASRWPCGHLMGQYRVEAEIGRGGMGVVLRAYDEELGRVVALKVLRSQESDANARARLVREAQAVAKLRHDNVVTVHAVVNPPDDAPYLVMEYLEGQSLAALIRSQGRLEPEEAAAILVQVAAGLELTHGVGLIHRDIKPSNIVVDPRTGRAKITDFGLARFAEGGTGLTQEGTLAGTPTYMSAEQARGTSELDGRSDIYSLGVTLYEALTGEVPFRGVPHMVFQQVVGEEPRPPRLLNDKIPRDLETICLKAMAKEPGRRYQTARAIAEDLSRWQRGEPIHARPVGHLERGWRWCRRKPLVAGLALALMVVIVAGVAGISWKWAEAVHERRRTERERDRAVRNFRQAREAVDTYLTQVSDNPALKAQNLEPLRRELLRTARDFYERFVQQEPDDPDLRAELGRAYARLGRITSILESRPRALEHYQKMQAIFDRLHTDYPDNPVYQKELAESYLRQAESLRNEGLALVEAAFHRSRALQEELVRAHPEEPAYQHDLARLLRSLGNYLLFMPNDYAQAENVLLEARKIYGGLPASYMQQPTVQVDHAMAILNLAKVYGFTDRPEPYRAAAEAAFALFEPVVRTNAENPDYVLNLCDSLIELGESHLRLSQPDQAEATWKKALGYAEKVTRSHPFYVYSRHTIADIYYSLASLYYHELHSPGEARLQLRKALDIEQELARDHWRVSEYGFYLLNIVRNFRDWFGDTALLEAICDQLTATIRQGEAPIPPEKRDDVRLGIYYSRRGAIRGLRGRYSEALSDLEHGRWPDLGFGPRLDAQRGEYDRAETAAMKIAEGDPGNGQGFYAAAQIVAYMAGVVRNDRALPAARREGLADKYGRQAVVWLQKAQSLKYLSTPSTRYLLVDDRDLDPLRSRDDFRALVARSNRPPRKGE